MSPRHALQGPLRELAGWALACALSIVVAAHALEAQHDLLLTDPDSLVTVLQARSILAGLPPDWALSPVLFVPEAALYGVLHAVCGFFAASPAETVRWALSLNAIANLLALYGAVRVVAGRRGATRSPVLAALLAFGAFCALALLENDPLPANVLAALTTTTTYYSATVVASVALVGVLARALGAPKHPVMLAVAAGFLGLVSMLSNPLFAAWAMLPLLVVAAAIALTRRGLLPVAAWASIGALIAGSALGYLARITVFAGVIVADDDKYARPELWLSSLQRYLGFVERMGSSATGIAWLVIVAGLTLAALAAAVFCWLRVAGAQDAGTEEASTDQRGTGEAISQDAVSRGTQARSASLIASYAALAPLAVTGGMIALGTQSERYLQPWALAPVLVLALMPVFARRAVESRHAPSDAPKPHRLSTAVRPIAATLAAVAILTAGAIALPRVIETASAPDGDLACVDAWAAAHPERTGGGQFATIRAPKAYASDPSRLVQVDEWLRPYLWLVDRGDYTHAPGVTYLVIDERTTPYDLPSGAAPIAQIACGRFTILDFGETVLPFGEPHS